MSTNLSLTRNGWVVEVVTFLLNDEAKKLYNYKVYVKNEVVFMKKMHLQCRPN